MKNAFFLASNQQRNSKRACGGAKYTNCTAKNKSRSLTLNLRRFPRGTPYKTTALRRRWWISSSAFMRCVGLLHWTSRRLCLRAMIPPGVLTIPIRKVPLQRMTPTLNDYCDIGVMELVFTRVNVTNFVFRQTPSGVLNG